MERYINLFTYIVIRCLMTFAINQGINAATKGRKKTKARHLSPL